MRFPALVVLSLLGLFLPACARPDQAELTDDERVLYQQITRDPYLVVLRVQRGEDGVVEVITRQGGRDQRYRLAPAVEGGKELRLRPVDEDLAIPAERPAYPGTGPEPRGISR